MTFKDLGLIEPILKALATEGYETPTPIQQQAIPVALQGRDLLGCAQTGTGKTAAFALPIIQRHTSIPPRKGAQARIRTLILTPTRELAIQIGDSFKAYGRNTPLRYTVIFGGVGQQPQTDALQRGVDILVATPGRLLDLMQQGFVHLNDLEVFVLDEADRMLDMGFIHDVRKVIAKLPRERQTLFFSATMPPEIQKLADSILNNPEKVAVTPVSSTAEKVSQCIYFAEKKEKKALLTHLLQNPDIRFALVFSRTKHGANKIAKDLNAVRISAEAIHGNKSQTARQTALSNFKNGKTRILVATDIAARGIDIDDLAYVFNYDLPNVPETYVHRIGRTGRAGASGQAISFCDMEERAYLRDIEKLTGQKIPVLSIDPALKAHIDAQPAEAPSPKPEFGPRPSERRAAQKQQPAQRNEQRPNNNGNNTAPQQNRPQQPVQRSEQRPNNTGNNAGAQPSRPQQPAQRNEQRPNNNGNKPVQGQEKHRDQFNRSGSAKQQHNAPQNKKQVKDAMDWSDLDTFDW